MGNITGIAIKTSSGMGWTRDAFHDALIIQKDYMQYEYKPDIESEYNYSRSWTYKSSDAFMREVFRGLADCVFEIINWKVDIKGVDTGQVVFEIQFDDNTELRLEFWASRDCFEECFRAIKRYISLIPFIEKQKTALYNFDDEEEKEV